MADVQGLIREMIFAMKFSSVPNDDQSEISFGGINNDLIGSNPIALEKNYHTSYWLLRVVQMRFGTKEIKPRQEYVEIITSETHMRMVKRMCGRSRLSGL